MDPDLESKLLSKHNAMGMLLARAQGLPERVADPDWQARYIWLLRSSLAVLDAGPEQVDAYPGSQTGSADGKR